MDVYLIFRILLLSVSLIFLGYLIVMRWKANKNDKVKNGKTEIVLSATQVLKEFIAENGCKIQEESEDKENEFTYLNFKYNGGIFTATASTRTQELLVFYPGILSTTTDMCTYASMLADRFTSNVKFVKVYTQFHEKDNEVVIDLSYEAIGISSESLSFILDSMQSIANDIRQEWDKQSEKYSRENVLDSRREFYLLHAAEFLNQNKDSQVGVSADSTLTIGSVISKLYNVDEIAHLLTLDVYSDSGAQKFFDPKTIYSLNLIDLVYNRLEKVPREPVFIKILSEQYVYLMNVETISETEFTAFIRLSVMRETKELNHDATISNISPTSSAVSFVVSYDKTGDLNHRNEYQYMLLDAQDKMKDGRESELSHEQKILLSATRPSNYLYVGSKLFFSERYYEAIWYLEPEFDEFALNLSTWNAKEQSFFVELAYLIGFSYYHLHNYKMAVYYLYFTQVESQLRYSMMLINALVEAKDVRVFREIDSMLESVNALAEKDELSYSKQLFGEFLLRRRAKACIDFRDLESAEKVFVKLLDYPASKDYAQEQLELIKQQKKQNSENTEN